MSLREFLRVRLREYDAADTDHDGEPSLEEVLAAFENAQGIKPSRIVAQGFGTGSPAATTDHHGPA